MNTGTIPDVKEIFRQAAEIAQQVPENMQVAAFNRALDLLTGLNSNSQAALAGNPAPSNSLPSSSSRAPQRQAIATNVDEFITQLDTTQHPGVASAAKALDRALMVLQIALRNHNLDGMTPPEIARVLTEKFRLNTSPDAVTVALGSATTLVNRISRGRAYEYKIMGPGEGYLKHLGRDGEGSSSIKSSPNKTPSNLGRKAKRKVTKESNGEKPVKSKSARVGPKQMLETLIEEGYFSTPRDIAQIIKHLQDDHARTYKSTDLSPGLTRLLREKTLERSKNEKGIFQYTAKR